MGHLVAERRSWREWALVRADWQQLVESSPFASFFHSTPWIETWLEAYGPALQTEIVLLRHDGRPVAGGLLTFRTERRGPIVLRTVYLNACGEDEHEETALEFNDLLCLPGHEHAAARALRQILDGVAWDEFLVPGCRHSEASDALKAAFADTELACTTVPSYFIDLEAARKLGAPFEMTLSHRRRQKIRHCLKAYRAEGAVELERSQNAEQALTQLRALAALHQESWRSRGKLGAFHSERFVRFHEVLLARAFEAGHIQTLAVRCGRETIGVVHCFGWRKKLYFYQCGFRYSANKRLSPGLVTILLSIQRFLEDGWGEFDLMAGDSEYKKAFSDESRELQWLTFRRRTLRTRALAALGLVRAAFLAGLRRFRNGRKRSAREAGLLSRTHRSEEAHELFAGLPTGVAAERGGGED